MKAGLLVPVGGAIIATVLAVVLILIGGNKSQDVPTTNTIEKFSGSIDVGSKVPNFTLNDFSGAPVSLSQFLGKPVVVNFWTAWCPFCIDEMPDFEKVHQELGEKVVFLGIHRTATEDKKIAEEFGKPLVSYPLLADATDEVYKTLTSGRLVMPFTMILDKEGKVAFRKFGPMTADELREQTQKVI